MFPAFLRFSEPPLYLSGKGAIYEQYLILKFYYEDILMTDSIDSFEVFPLAQIQIKVQISV